MSCNTSTAKVSSLEISAPVENTVIYHTADHNNERVTASIRWRPEVRKGRQGGSGGGRHIIPMVDRLRILAIPSEVIQNLTPRTRLKIRIISSNRAVQSDVAQPILVIRSRRVRLRRGRRQFLFEEDNAFPFHKQYRQRLQERGKNRLNRRRLVSMPGTEFIFNQWNTRIRKDFAGIMPPTLPSQGRGLSRRPVWAGRRSGKRTGNRAFYKRANFCCRRQLRPRKRVEVQGALTIYKLLAVGALFAVYKPVSSALISGSTPSLPLSANPCLKPPCGRLPCQLAVYRGAGLHFDHWRLYPGRDSATGDQWLRHSRRGQQHFSRRARQIYITMEITRDAGGGTGTGSTDQFHSCA